MSRPFNPREHGTDRGYYQHRHRGEPQCDPCRAAHTTHQREKEAARIVLATERRFFVYRLWNADGRLLYIGCSDNPSRRRRTHRRIQPWGSQVHGMTTDGPFHLHTGLAVEARAIYLEQPLYNDSGRDPQQRAYLRRQTQGASP